MQTIKIIGEVDQDGRLIATVPASIGPGPVELLVFARNEGEDDAGENWMSGIAREWHDELSDSRQDIYTRSDGVPSDGSR